MGAIYQIPLLLLLLKIMLIHVVNLTIIITLDFRVQFINNTEGNTITIKAHNGAVFGIAFDSIHRYLYWGDARKNIIGISTWNGSYTATLLTRQDGIGTPRSIAVDPQNGQVAFFFTLQKKRKCGLIIMKPYFINTSLFYFINILNLKKIVFMVF